METTKQEPTIADLIRRVTEGNETVMDVSVGEDGERKVRFGQRKLQPELPMLKRTESPPKAHAFHTAESLTAYLAQYGSETTVVLLDTTALKGCAVLSETDGNQFELLAFEPVRHPLFAEWSAILGRRVDVIQFAEFVMGHRRQIIAPDGKETALLFSQLQASTKTTVARGQGRTAINGVMCETKIQGKTAEAFVELPDSLTIRLPLFIGEPEQNIEIDLLVGSQDATIWVSASASGVLDAQLRAFSGMADRIREELTEAVVGLGRVGHGAWKYLQA